MKVNLAKMLRVEMERFSDDKNCLGKIEISNKDLLAFCNLYELCGDIRRAGKEIEGN